MWNFTPWTVVRIKRNYVLYLRFFHSNKEVFIVAENMFANIFLEIILKNDNRALRFKISMYFIPHNSKVQLLL